MRASPNLLGTDCIPLGWRPPYATYGEAKLALILSDTTVSLCSVDLRIDPDGVLTMQYAKGFNIGETYRVYSMNAQYFLKQ